MYFENLLSKWTSFLPYCHHKIYSKENDRFLYVHLVDRICSGLSTVPDNIVNAVNTLNALQQWNRAINKKVNCNSYLA